ncbi:MAG: type II toxin-antitoxin system RelE/ParE family toxin [Chloroflexi bacterium]|nr:type II toxin-antitoxin system RelE/ParE family toxin [Chloroflexota bacterium]
MASFSIEFKPSVQRDFRRLPKSAAERALKRIENLQNEPFPHGVEKLEGADRLYRIRVGEYRIIYQVEPQVHIITILYVRHRRGVYRAL